jgi:tetratricopeptide (TPR) repeat protein/O-antigen ligase
MRRLLFILLAFYFVFLGGSSYYYQVFPLRFFHHGFVTVLLAWWLINRLRRGEGLPATPLNLPLVVLVVVWFISGLAGLDWRMSLEHNWFLLTHVLIFFVLVDLIQRGRQRLVMETQFLLGALVVLISLLQLASWYFGLGITPESRIGWISVIGQGVWLPLQVERLWLALGVSTWVAGYAAPLVIVVAGWALTVRRRDYQQALRLLAGGLLMATLLTFSRGGIVALAASVAVWLLLEITPRISAEGFSRRGLPLLAILMGVIGVSVAGVLIISQNPGRITGDAKRLDLWNSAVEMIRDYPVSGVGTGMFGRGLQTYRDPSVVDERLSTAHNIYLNTAAEIGFAGMVICAVLAVIVLRSWWWGWQNAPSPAARRRLTAVYAALVGVAAQSLFDNFMMTSLVSLFLVLLAYSVALHTVSVPARSGASRGLAWGMLALVVGYGLWFVQVDRAHLNALRSLRESGTDALNSAQAAAEIDPALRLYPLQAHFLAAALSDDVQAAIDEYEQAVALEPAWDTGWLNLAGLAEQQGDYTAALYYLERARALNYGNPGGLHWARLAEATGAAPEADILDAYLITLQQHPGHLPLSEFWGETSLRRQAVQLYSADLPLDQQYRIVAVHQPELRAALVPDVAESAAEWWVVGEYALTVEGDAQRAVEAFTEAIARDRQNGDYYVSRARASLGIDSDATARDLNIAELLGALFEHPDAVQVALAQSPEEIHALRVRAVPPRVVSQNFEAVLFGRVAQFDVIPSMRLPGPGRAAMQPWYDIAVDYEASGDFEGAMQVYRAILDYAPDEQAARDALTRLTG